MIMKLFTAYRLTRKTGGTVIPAILLGATLLAAGCASMPAPTEQVAVSRAAVKSAINQGGNEFAPLETKSAIDKMAAADRAMAEKKYLEAKRLAEQAQLDAKLAETKADYAKTQKAVENSQESNRVLREEIDRTNK